MSVAQRPSGRGASGWSRRGRRTLAPSLIGRCGPWSPATAGAPEQGEADIRGRGRGARARGAAWRRCGVAQEGRQRPVGGRGAGRRGWRRPWPVRPGAGDADRRLRRPVARRGHGEKGGGLRRPELGRTREGEEARLTSRSRDGAAGLVGVDGDADEEEEGRRG